MDKLVLFISSLALLSCSKIDKKVDYKMEASCSSHMTYVHFGKTGTVGCNGGVGTFVSCTFTAMDYGILEFKAKFESGDGSPITLKIWEGKKLKGTYYPTKSIEESNEWQDVYIIKIEV